MIIREFEKKDQVAVEAILALYWTDPEFLKEVSGELRSHIENGSQKNSSFFVAEEDGEIIGVGGLRKLPDYLKEYAQTDNPVELYVIAVKQKRRGVGKSLKLKLIEEAQKHRFSEILLYSPHTHDGSWEFHDTFNFERVGQITPPEDDIGYLWQKIL